MYNKICNNAICKDNAFDNVCLDIPTPERVAVFCVKKTKYATGIWSVWLLTELQQYFVFTWSVFIMHSYFQETTNRVPQ